MITTSITTIIKKYTFSEHLFCARLCRVASRAVGSSPISPTYESCDLHEATKPSVPQFIHL